MKNCPICDKKNEYWCDTMGYTLMEESFKCQDGHYDYYFSTGGYQERMGLVEDYYSWTWSYTTPKDELAAIEAEQASVVKRLHSDYKKYHEVVE